MKRVGLFKNSKKRAKIIQLYLTAEGNALWLLPYQLPLLFNVSGVMFNVNGVVFNVNGVVFNISGGVYNVSDAVYDMNDIAFA